MRIGLIILIAIVVAAIINGAGSRRDDHAPSPPHAAAAPPPEKPVLSPEQTAQKDAADREWLLNVLSVRAVRDAMKNPDSFKLEQALRMDDGTLCLTYRATNSFNAIVPGYAVIPTKDKAYASGQNGFDRAWKKRCNGKSGSDITYIRRAL